jgi:diamine N-acetyltransferase
MDSLANLHPNLLKKRGSEKLKAVNQTIMESHLPTGEPIRFKTATAADAQVLLDLIRKYFEYDHIPFQADEIRPGLMTLLNDASVGQAWLIECGMKPAGYVLFTYGFDLEFGGRLAFITDLYLEPEFRGKGLGQKTLERVGEFCRSSGVRALELQVERDNVEAQALYRKFGFTAADRIPMSKRL